MVGLSGASVLSSPKQTYKKMAKRTVVQSKVNSITLHGVIVDFEDNGTIYLHNKYEHDGNIIKLNSIDIDTIRLQAIKNGRIEAGNGVEIVNKEAVK